MSANPAQLSSTLDRLGLLDFPTLRAGWGAGWVDRPEVVAVAARRLAAAPEQADDELVALAGADDADAEVIGELLARLAERSGPLAEEESRRRWWLAHLEALVHRGLAPEDLVEQAEQLWAELGYPPELARLSPYYDGPTPDGSPPDPARAPGELLASLQSELGVRS